MALIFIYPSQRKETCVLLMSVLFLCSAVFNNSKMTTINVTRYDNLLHLQTWYLLQWQGQNIVMTHGPSITLLQQINVEFNQLVLSSILLSLSTDGHLALFYRESSHEFSTFWNEHGLWEETQSQSYLRRGTAITWTGSL